MVGDDHAIIWLSVVLALLCPVGLYWSIEAVLVGLVLVRYIHCVEFHNTPSEYCVLLHVVRSKESCPCVGTKGEPLGNSYHKNVL